jgi:hypothetical protein
MGARPDPDKSDQARTDVQAAMIVYFPSFRSLLRKIVTVDRFNLMRTEIVDYGTKMRNVSSFVAGLLDLRTSKVNDSAGTKTRTAGRTRCTAASGRLIPNTELPVWAGQRRMTRSEPAVLIEFNTLILQGLANWRS